MRIVINADDLGMDPAQDEVILDCLRRGVCTSASVLPNGPSTASLRGRLEVLDHVSFGVHLNVTEFRPLTPVRALAPLLDHGAFGPRTLQLDRTQVDAVYEEWCAQVVAVRELGVTLSHLDSHQHVHYHPLLLNALKRVQARFGIDRLRGMATWRPGGGPSAWRQLARGAWFNRTLRQASPEGITTDGFASVSLFREVVQAGRLRGHSFELMCHPGNPHSPDYAEELRWLEGDWTRSLGVPVEKVSWWGIG